MPHPGWMFPLFVPATRPDRFAKAAASGADAIILDLEDAVDPSDKDGARQNVGRARGLGVDIILRVNPVGTVWHEADLRCAREAGVKAIMLPKTESSMDVGRIHDVTGLPVVALIETPAALGRLDALASIKGVAQLAFGSMDMGAELGCAPTAPILAPIRLGLLAASARVGIAPPLDGVSLTLADAAVLEQEARDIALNGFSGRMLIHPSQVEPTARGLAPAPDELSMAEKVAQSTGAVVRIDGRMVDRPVRLNAERLIRRETTLNASLSKARRRQDTGDKTE